MYKFTVNKEKYPRFLFFFFCFSVRKSAKMKIKPTKKKKKERKKENMCVYNTNIKKFLQPKSSRKHFLKKKTKKGEKKFSCV